MKEQPRTGSRTRRANVQSAVAVVGPDQGSTRSEGSFHAPQCRVLHRLGEYVDVEMHQGHRDGAVHWEDLTFGVDPYGSPAVNVYVEKLGMWSDGHTTIAVSEPQFLPIVGYKCLTIDEIRPSQSTSRFRRVGLSFRATNNTLKNYVAVFGVLRLFVSSLALV